MILSETVSFFRTIVKEVIIIVIKETLSIFKTSSNVLMLTGFWVTIICSKRLISNFIHDFSDPLRIFDIIQINNFALWLFMTDFYTNTAAIGLIL